VADDRGLAVKAADDGLEVVGDLADRLAGEHLGWASACWTVSGSSGHAGVNAA
jgi:hypothetical protein